MDFSNGEKKLDTSTPVASISLAPPIYDPSQESRLTRAGLTLESFKRAPGRTERIAVNTAEGTVAQEDIEGGDGVLQHQMKPRHLQMIAVGGSIGTGLFIGTGNALVKGGPLGMLIGWAIMAAMLLCIVQAIGELAILYPVEGGFYSLTNRFIDKSFGFAMGLNYMLQWVVVLPLELTAVATTIQYWDQNVLTQQQSVGTWVTVFFVLIIFINVLGTTGYAEEEFWSALIKLTVIIMFIILGAVLNAGGGPASGLYSEYVGGRFWRDPGALTNGFKGVCAVFVTAAFSYAGTELVGIAVAETPNPEKAMPGAIKALMWRIMLIFVTTILLIGLLVPSTDPRLLGAENPTSTSPFVIVMDLANISGLPHLMNVVILMSVTSIGLASVYAGSRTLTALADNGYAPKIFTYVDKAGRPLYSVLFCLAWGPIAYVNLKPDIGGQVLDWLIAVSGLSTIVTWISIAICHLRFRRAWRIQGHSLDELPYRATFGIWGSWFAITILTLVLIAQFYIAVWPLGGSPNAEDFFMSYLAAPVIIAFYACGWLFKRSRPVRAKDIDLDTGRKAWYTAEFLNARRAEERQRPWHRRLFKLLFQ